MQIAVKSLFALCLLSSATWAVEPTAPTTTPVASVNTTQPKPSLTTAPIISNTVAKPLTAEQIAKAKHNSQ